MTDPTPSQTLRAAATRLRELAAKSNPGPWHKTDSGFGVRSSNGTNVVTDEDLQHGGTDDADWIASMSPVVAKPLAAWLEDTARLIDQWLLSTGAAVEGVAFAHSILEQP
jgi:hypothetical protein